MKKIFIVLFLVYSQLAFSQLNPLMLSNSKKENVEVSKVKEKIYSEEEKEKLKSPQDTMRTFIEAMDRVKNGSANSINEAVLTLNLNEIDKPLRNLTGKVTAERLVNTIDRIAKINFIHIPNYSEGPKWHFRKQTVTIGDKVYDVEIAIEKTEDGVWKFSAETVNSIENFYTSLASQKVVDGVLEYKTFTSKIKSKMPLWMSDEFLFLKKGQWISLMVLMLVALFFFWMVRIIATTYLNYKVKNKSLDYLPENQFKSTLPFGCLAFSLTWLIGGKFLDFDVEMLAVFVRGAYILTAISSVWAILAIVDYISLHFEKLAKDTDNKFDDVLVPMISKFSKVVIVSFGAIFVAHSLTFDVASILAGLGIGGVAIALAAKDTISNLFGSITVILDRPFQIGDYILLDKNLEGTVEEVGFRSTRIRTPHNSLVTMPNSVLANMAIDNYGMRKMRRYKVILQFSHTTDLKKIEEFCERIKYMIQLNSIIQKDNAVVSLYDTTMNSVDVLLTVFFLTDQIKIELEERHKFLSEVLKIAEELGISFAVPSTMVVPGRIELPTTTMST